MIPSEVFFTETDATIKPVDQAMTALQLKVIAEGVENEAQLAFLNAYGCQYAQGYLFGRPLTNLQFIKLVTTGELEQNIV